ncbi:unnamed protein product [Nippostrongylus brasiliensis]|uniref:Uncharacterized protein n=1 Tax=Nippostrongylus brasiliensis TaxID=27835 RepID=A0A0N4XLI4_NIPBR|nr:unnamed protein product [Nippostrongylus brasiliensis]
MYYVSETDMLKAMRMALYDEVIRTPGMIQNQDLDGLTDFITVLSNVLKNSERARFVFLHMREFLESRRGRRSRVYANPFPVNSSWQHCKGTLPTFRLEICSCSHLDSFLRSIYSPPGVLINT